MVITQQMTEEEVIKILGQESLDRLLNSDNEYWFKMNEDYGLFRYVYCFFCGRDLCLKLIRFVDEKTGYTFRQYYEASQQVDYNENPKQFELDLDIPGVTYTYG